MTSTDFHLKMNNHDREQDQDQDHVSVHDQGLVNVHEQEVDLYLMNLNLIKTNVDPDQEVTAPLKLNLLEVDQDLDHYQLPK